MRARFFAPSLVFALAGAFPILASAPATESASPRIIQEIKAHSEAMTNLEYMCDTFGPRLTGSERLEQAQAWAAGKLTSYGAVNVHQEAYDFGPRWIRGTESAHLLTQNGMNLHVASMGWGLATKGPLRGEVVLFEAKTLEEMAAFKGKLGGKIMLIGELPKPKPGENPQAFYKTFMETIVAMRSEPALATLIPAEKAGNRLTAAGSPRGMGPMGKPTKPTAFIAKGDAATIRRILARGEKVEMELNLGSSQSEKPVQAYNTIAEIRGTEKPEEMVILGAHIDSWDLAQGATDNGTGTVAVMEALRGILATGLKPKRTIRVVLFSGEEEGLLGSEAYVKDHGKELDNVQAVLVDDSGSTKITGWNLQSREDLKPLMEKAIAPAAGLGVVELNPELHADSDHASFLESGVPAFFGRQDYKDYLQVMHHSQVDNIEFVKPDELLQGAQALAVTAWELANMNERLPHKSVKPHGALPGNH